MNRKIMLVLMLAFAAAFVFVTASSILSGCAGQVPAPTVFVLTATPTP